MKRLSFLILLLCARLPAAESLTLLPGSADGRLRVLPQGAAITNWTGRTFDDSGWTAVLTPVGFEVPPPPVQAAHVLADSVAGFSSVQGSNGWSYGFYNRVADSNQSYDPTTEFNATDPNFGFQNGAWQLGAGGNLAANPPWDSIGPLDMHPNATGGEHWVIRRYTSSVAGRVRIAGVLGNVNGLGGTLARILVNGQPIFSSAVGSQGFGYSVLASVNVGSKIDFALDPNGSDSSDATRWTAVILPATEGAAVTADSVTDFSGVQGLRNWSYGFYNRSQDVDGHYDAVTDFQSSAPGWGFAGGEWALGPDDPPWDALGPQYLQPNGVNDGEEHWVIRRWICPFTGPVTVDWHFAKEIPYGEGATLQVRHNGVLKDSLTVAGGDRLGAVRSLVLDMHAGDFLDFAGTPLGLEDDDGDGADRCVFHAWIYVNTVQPGAECVAVADSRADWSTNGQQGYRNWFYGYYNKTADLTPGYQPGDFTAFPREGTGWSRTNFWRGSDWDWNPDLTPWDNLGLTAASPNGANNGAEHWVIRRWVSSVSGRVRINWFTRKSNPFGSGVTAKLLHNGVEKDTASLGGGDLAGVTRQLDLAGVAVGDTLDLALTPVGPAGATDDSGDGSANGMSISTCVSIADVLATTLAGAQRPSTNDSVLLRVPFLLADTSRLDTVTLRLRYDDGLVAWLNGVEIARRNVAGVDLTSELAARAADCRTAAQALTVETLDITPFKGVLVNGLNVLAIQGWNCAEDSDFLLAPELTATATTNRPPIAGMIGVATTQDRSVTWTAALFLANDSDPDGDELSLPNVQLISARGGSVSLTNGGVVYQPPPGFTGEDHYTYTVSDGRGGSATGMVQVLVVTGALPAANQVLLSPISQGLRLRFRGSPGQSYAVQRSDDLKTWSTVTTLAAPWHGLIELNDLENAAGVTSVFYRTVLAP